MITKLAGHIKGIINGPNKKKVIENTVTAIIIGIILIIAGGTFFRKGDQKGEDNNIAEKLASPVDACSDREKLEKSLERLLSQIEGVGSVSVMITYISGKEIVPAYEIKKNDEKISEKDSGGGTRERINSDFENKLVYEDISGGAKKPLILKDMEASVRGVVVAAEGAGDASVKECISKAVQTLLGIPAHRVQVLKKK